MRAASAQDSRAPRKYTVRSGCPGHMSCSLWICMCALVCCCKKRMFSPPRPMIKPTLRCGMETVAATSTWEAASRPQPWFVNGDGYAPTCVCCAPGIWPYGSPGLYRVTGAA